MYERPGDIFDGAEGPGPRRQKHDCGESRAQGDRTGETAKISRRGKNGGLS
jgi:hypothetical protein